MTELEVDLVITKADPPVVVLLVPRASGGGAEAVARQWAEYLTAAGADGRLITYDDSSGVVSLKKTGRGPRLLRLARSAASDIGNDVDVVVGVLTYSNLILLLASAVYRTPWKVVITEHSIASVLLRHEGRSGNMKLWFARRLYRRAAAAVGVSHPVSADLRGAFKLPAERVHTIGNPIPLLSSGPAWQTGPEGRLNVVGVGRLSSQKRFDLFLRVVKVLKDRGTDVECSILGDGELGPALRETARSLSVDVSLPGWQTRWTTMAGAYDVLLLTSEVEGFGNVIVEAADAGLPAVVSAASLGSSEALIHGVTGVIARTDDPEDLADAVLQARLLGRVLPPGDWRRRFTPEVSGAALLNVCCTLVPRP